MSYTRTFTRRLHLWFGLSLGTLLAVLGLTGSALVFYVEIDSMLHPFAQETPAEHAPDWDSPVWNDVLATAQREYPDPGGQWSFEVDGKAGSIPARFYPSHQAHHGHHAEREMVWFSADGQRVVRAEAWGDYLMSWLYELHMHLLAGEMGSLVVGWGGMASLLLLITGLVTWWPRGSWRNALSFKRRAVSLRRLRDLHKHAGLWSLLFLILLVFTGALLALPDVKQQILAATLVAPDPMPEPQSTRGSVARVPLAEALAAGHAALPDAQLAFIDVYGDGSPIRLRVQVPGDPHRRFPASFVFIDPFTGKALAVHDAGRGNAATRVSWWIRSIHDGSIAGTGTRVLAIVLGIVPAGLLVTGFLYWQQRRSRRQSHPLHASQPQERNP
jgi:uncharacterized iron-regulated membrane protein